MAEREIRLVGSFKDDITPKLKKLNAEIDRVAQSFTKMQSKLRPIARDMGVLAMASERLGSSLKSQRSGFETNIRAMQQYRSEMGKISRAQRAIKPTALPSPKLPRPAAGGGMPRGGRGGGAAGGGGGIADIAIGSAIGGVMTNAIVAGFQQGVNLMMAPMRAFGGAFAERVGDEMQDIKSAGGMFALDKKSKTPLFSSFEDAMSMQEGLNRSLAKSAAALPGATGDYVKAARGLTDTVMGAFTKNEEAFKKFAVELGAKEGATSEEAITKVLQRFTEQTVLLGQGQTGGMPLTMLMEQLVTREAVSVQAMAAKYAQLRSNPLLAGMLQDAEAEINKTTAGTADRFRAVMKALDAALPQEVVNKMRRSVSGLIEATKSGFIDPDTGLFGLSRELNVMVPKVNQFGQAVGKLGDKEVALGGIFEIAGKQYGYALDKMGNTTNQLVAVTEENTSLFKIMKETLANFAVPILELIGVLPQIFDPFAKIAEQFRNLREVSNRFFLAFNTYTNGFEDQANEFSKQAEKVGIKSAAGQALKRQANILKEQASSRGALGALNKAMLDFGAIGVKEYENNIKKLTDFDPKAVERFGEKGMADMARSLLTSLVNSDLVASIVETIGSALAAAVDTAFTAIDGLLGGIEGKTGNKLVDAFGRGFSKIITPERANQIADIFDRLLTKLFNVAADLIVNKVIPAIGVGIMKTIQATWQTGLLGKFLVVVGVLAAFQKAVMMATAAMQTMSVLGRGGGGGPTVTGGGRRGGRRGGGLSFVGSRPARGISKFKGGLQTALAPAAPVAMTMMGMQPGRSLIRQQGAVGGALRGAAKVGRYVPGGALAFGAADAGLRMAAGEGPGKAIGGAAASVIGSTLGGILGQALIPIPGLGAAIGGVAGGFIGDAIFSKLTTPATAQEQAAKLQLDAANKQLAASQQKISAVGGPELGAAGVGVADPMKLNAVISMMGLQQNQLAQQYQSQAEKVRALSDATGVVKDQLYAKVDELKKIGYTPEQIWRQSDVQGLQTRYQELQDKTKVAGDKLKETFDKMPQNMSRGIATAMQKIDTKAIEFAIANKINMANTPTANIGAGNIYGTGGSLFTPPKPGPSVNPLFAPTNPFTVNTGFAKGNFNTPLGKAISYEMRHKPPGSDLVVANSSETIIPAANGLVPKNYMRNEPMPTMAMAGGGSFNGAGGGFEVGKVEVTINDNTGDIAKVSDRAAEMILQSMYRQARAEVITS